MEDYRIVNQLLNQESTRVKHNKNVDDAIKDVRSELRKLDAATPCQPDSIVDAYNKARTGIDKALDALEDAAELAEWGAGQ